MPRAIQSSVPDVFMPVGIRAGCKEGEFMSSDDSWVGSFFICMLFVAAFGASYLLNPKPADDRFTCERTAAQLCIDNGYFNLDTQQIYCNESKVTEAWCREYPGGPSSKKVSE